MLKESSPFLSEVAVATTAPFAFAAGASAIGCGSCVNKLTSDLAMVATISSLESIVSHIDSVVDMTRSIATAAEEQSMVSEEVSESIQSIERSTKEIWEEVEKVKKDAQELSALATEETQNLAWFKI